MRRRSSKREIAKYLADHSRSINYNHGSLNVKYFYPKRFNRIWLETLTKKELKKLCALGGVDFCLVYHGILNDKKVEKNNFVPAMTDKSGMYLYFNIEQKARKNMIRDIKKAQLREVKRRCW